MSSNRERIFRQWHSMVMEWLKCSCIARLMQIQALVVVWQSILHSNIFSVPPESIQQMDTQILATIHLQRETANPTTVTSTCCDWELDTPSKPILSSWSLQTVACRIQVGKKHTIQHFVLTQLQLQKKNATTKMTIDLLRMQSI